MSKTGIYKFNVQTGKVEKVSDDLPRLKQQVYFPGASEHSGHHFENLGDRTFYSKDEKRQYMREHKIAEAG